MRRIHSNNNEKLINIASILIKDKVPFHFFANKFTFSDGEYLPKEVEGMILNDKDIIVDWV